MSTTTDGGNIKDETDVNGGGGGSGRGGLVDSVSRLCSLRKKFHCNKREHELKSLTKYITEFKNFSQEEFVAFTCRYYVKSLRERKRFCSQSIYNRISAIQSRYDLNVMSRRRYNSVLKSLRKLFNPYSRDTDYYTNTGDMISIPPDEMKQLRENARYMLEQSHTSQADRWILNTYTDQEIEIVYNYFLLNLKNFIASRRDSPPDMVFIELCLLVVFSYNTPRRIAEIINLQMQQIDDLIVQNTLNIKSKDGFSIDCIYISTQLSDLLQRYVVKVFGDADPPTYRPETKLFNATYKMYYTRMRNTLKVLIGEERIRNLRIFHGFRNYFASKHLADANECKKILGHRNLNMTRRYARHHTQTQDGEQQKKTQVVEYLNKTNL